MKQNLLLGYDIGSSSVKTSLINADSGELVISDYSPKQEMKINSPQIGWAEQDPNLWWKHLVISTKKILTTLKIKNYEIIGIGISYQMHGLVMVDKNLEVIYPSIIWCDSRAVEIGNKAYADLGSDFCSEHCLNSPGNFTASKLKWVKENLPQIYSKIFKIMLPGDYIALKLSDRVNTTISGLSEGIFWDFVENKLFDELINYYELNRNLISEIVPTFGIQGKLTTKAATELGLKPGIPIAYRAGDQPNNALSLNVLSHGEFAANAGTSGVIYGVTNRNIFDTDNRVNTFAHVNYSNALSSKGVLLCINGTGIQYSWLRQNIFNNKFSYTELNEFASKVKIGSEGLLCYPFGNGAERVLRNKNVSANISKINFNLHKKEHLIRASQEGIAFSFRFGLDVLRNLGMEIDVIKAGDSNLFQSSVFREAFVNTCKINLEIYNTDGSQGAARGAGIGIGYYDNDSSFVGLKKVAQLQKKEILVKQYHAAYESWKENLTLLTPN